MGFLAMLALYTIVAYGLTKPPSSWIDLLPSAVLDWIGGRAGAGDDGGERAGGAAVGGIARLGAVRIGTRARRGGAGADHGRHPLQDAPTAGKIMRIVQPGICALLLAVGAAWAAWLVGGYRPHDVAAAGLGLAVGASFAAYMAADRRDAALWLRFGLYGGSLAVAAATFWTGAVRPLQHTPSFGAATAWLDRLDGLGLVLLRRRGRRRRC